MPGTEYRLGLYEKALPASLSLAEKLAEAKRSGFDFLEISIDETDEKLARLKWGIEERRLLAETMFDLGIRFETLCLSGHRKYPIGSPDPRTEGRGMEILADAIGFASDLGIRIIQLAGYDVYYSESSEDTRDRFVRNLKTGVEWAAARGVILAFETMETAFMNTVSKALFFARKIDSPFLQIYPDIGNITNAAQKAGPSPFEDLRLGKGRIAAVHLKETVPGKFREIPFGTGHVDFPGCIQEALNGGVRLFVAEFWHDGKPDWQEKDDQARSFLQQQFDSVKGRQ